MRRRRDREGGIGRDDSSLAPLPSDLRLSLPRTEREKPLLAARGLTEGLMAIAGVCASLAARAQCTALAAGSPASVCLRLLGRR